MTHIHILSKSIAERIAAGEVVERPASVVKELIENALDAQARAISIEIRQGGVALLRVSDNGSGMSREDAALAVERFATSKIAAAEDLNAIKTLGFRGEALPSIASVAQLEILTRPTDALEGTRIRVVDGQIESRSCRRADRHTGDRARIVLQRARAPQVPQVAAARNRIDPEDHRYVCAGLSAHRVSLHCRWA